MTRGGDTGPAFGRQAMDMDVMDRSGAFRRKGERDASTSIDAILSIIPARPRLTSRTRGWGGVTIDVYDIIHDYSVRTPAHDHHLVCYCTGGGGRMAQGRDGVLHESLLTAGVSMMMPAGMDSIWEGDAVASVRFRIPVGIIEAAAEQLGHRSTATFEIRNIFETRDAMIERIAHIMTAELEHPAHRSQALIAEMMSCALAAHMLRSYNAFEMPVAEEVPPLGRRELGRLTEYIEDHLGRSIGLGELAAIAGVSRFHFARLFKRSTGTTAIAYVEQCRIRYAQALITESDRSLSEIALMSGFADQSHFTRRFHRHVGCTPAAFARDRGRRRTGRRAAPPGDER